MGSRTAAAQGRRTRRPARAHSAEQKCSCAGTHILLEFWGAKHLDDLQRTEKALTDAVSDCGANLLKVMLHKFSPSGIAGVAVLSESHISIHTWPEYGYAALDIFTGNKVNPHAAIPALRKAFAPKRIQLSEHKRGVRV